jgi:HNH endonuclease
MLRAMVEDGSIKDNKKFYSNEWSKLGKKRHNGYIYIRYRKHPNSDCDGWIGEHRLVMENSIRRYLETYEHIHHKNEDRADNRIENLEIHSNSSHYLEHHKSRRINDIAKRVCVVCGTNKPPLSSKMHKGYKYYYHRWHRNPLDKTEWICERCYSIIRRKIKNDKKNLSQTSI